MRQDVSVTFVLHGADLPALSRLDPDRDWREFVSGERAWILQTFLRLRAAGFTASLSDRLPRSGIAIFSAGQRTALARGPVQRTEAFLLATRQDRRGTPYADAEIVQNPTQADGDTRLYVPHWPQPALIPRDPSRGERVERVEYKGDVDNLHPEFRDPDWPRFLARHGLEWVCDGRVHRQGRVEARPLQWHDYAAIDLVLAVRPPDPDLHLRKPATKLCNAWLAGVPALLGPESAYRSLRRDELDYVEVTSRADAEAAVSLLIREPGLYARMRERAHVRAAECTVGQVTAAWLRLLRETVPELARREAVRRRHRRLVSLRDLGARVRRIAGAVPLPEFRSRAPHPDRR